jgi:hypothetical protein
VLAIGAIVGLAACGSGDGGTSGRASTRPSIDRPSPEQPDRTTDTETAEPDRTRSREPEQTTTPAPTTPPATTRPPTTPPATTRPPTTPPATTQPPAGPPTTQPPQAAPPTQPAATPQPSSTDTTATSEYEGVGPWGWVLLFGLIGAMILGLVVYNRTQKRTAWDSEARALEAETRAVTATRLAPVLSVRTAGERGLAWSPVRAGLLDIVGRWTGLTERAADDARRNWSLQISGLLQELIAAIDAENDGLALGRDWTLLRPRVTQAERSLASVLAANPSAQPPGPPGPPGAPGPSTPYGPSDPPQPYRP